MLKNYNFQLAAAAEKTLWSTRVLEKKINVKNGAFLPIVIAKNLKII